MAKTKKNFKKGGASPRLRPRLRPRPVPIPRTQKKTPIPRPRNKEDYYKWLNLYLLKNR